MAMRDFYRSAVAAIALATLTGCPSRNYTPREKQMREAQHQRNLDSLEREARQQMMRQRDSQNFGGYRP